MATPFADTPKWFDTNYYLDQKVALMQLTDPKGEWTRDKVLSDFAAHNIDNPYDHYKAFGDIEGLSPNPLFNNAEYLAAKAALMGSTWTVEMVAKDIQNAGLTLMEHYIQFGGKYENLSPSSAFDQNKYFDAKLQAHIAAEPDKGWTLDMVKADFAAAGITALEHYMLYGKVEGLDKYDYSVNGDPIPHPGNTKIVLTKGVDTVSPDAEDAAFRTSDRDDTISAVASTQATVATLNATDVIDGGAGVDTLKVDMAGNFNGFTTGSMKNVENVELSNASTKTFNAKGIENVQVYTVDGGEKGAIISNVNTADTDYVLKQAGGKFTVKIDDSALTGKTDNVDVTLNGVGTAASARVTLDVTGTSLNGKVEGLTLNAQKASFVTLEQGHKTVTVLGSADVDVLTKADLESFDASTATGMVVADLSADKATLKTINGGLSDDTITVAGLVASAIVDGGDGKDTLKFSAFTTETIKNTITDVETFAFNTAASGRDLTVDMTKMSGLETVKIEGASGADSTDDFIFKNAGATDLTLDLNNNTQSVQSFSFDGSSVLNVSLTGGATSATGGSTELKTLTAANATTLNITNASETSTNTLEIGDIVAKSVTAMTVDTGNYGVTISGGSADNLASLDSITLKGDGDAVITLDAPNTSKLNTINASELDGDLQLDLSAFKTETGVHLTMGNGGSAETDASNASGGITGTTKADIFDLGGSAETVNLTVSSTAAADVLNGFDGDFIRLYEASTVIDSYFTGTLSAGSVFTDKIYGFKDTTVVFTDTDSTKSVDVAITKQFVASKHAKVTASDNVYFAIDNGQGVGIFAATAAADINASAGGAVGSFTDGIKLVGVLNGITLADIDDATFVS